MDHTPHPCDHLTSLEALLDALETQCAYCKGAGTCEPPEWTWWTQRLAILTARAREARTTASLPPDQWVSNFENVVGIYGGGPSELPASVPAEVVAAEDALAQHDVDRPKSLRQGEQCPVCLGKGVHLTPVGVRLATVLEKYGFVRLSLSRSYLPPTPPDPHRQPPNEAYGQAEHNGTNG